MKCKWTGCSNDARAKSPFCGDTCYKRWNRENKSSPHLSGSTNSDKPVPIYPLNSDTTRTDMSSSDKDRMRDLVGDIGYAIDKMSTLPDCDCLHCQNNRANGSKHVLNHRAFKTAAELGDKELNRVSLPGDADYVGVAV